MIQTLTHSSEHHIEVIDVDPVAAIPVPVEVGRPDLSNVVAIGRNSLRTVDTIPDMSSDIPDESAARPLGDGSSMNIERPMIGFYKGDDRTPGFLTRIVLKDVLYKGTRQHSGPAQPVHLKDQPKPVSRRGARQHSGVGPLGLGVPVQPHKTNVDTDNVASNLAKMHRSHGSTGRRSDPNGTYRKAWQNSDDGRL